MRLCFVGDSFVNGVGDAEGLGWRGRVTAAALKAGLDVTAYDLGIRRDTSGDIRARWQAETAARLPAGLPHRLLFAFGTNDCADDGAGSRRVTLADTLANADAILGQARRRAPTLMVGPPPILDDAAVDARIAELERALAALCGRLGVPFLPVLDRLRHDAWTGGARAGDGTHPDAEGYALLAREILAWPAFRDWIGLSPLQGNQR
jgi:lysophospholipase L1-like esterase